jgi:hypothetical protein
LLLRVEQGVLQSLYNMHVVDGAAVKTSMEKAKNFVGPYARLVALASSRKHPKHPVCLVHALTFGSVQAGQDVVNSRELIMKSRPEVAKPVQGLKTETSKCGLRGHQV